MVGHPPRRANANESPLHQIAKEARQEKNATPPNFLRGGSDILLERAQEGVLLLRGLVRAVAELRRRVDPFQVDLLQGLPRCVHEHGLPEGHDPLLDTRDGALQDDEVVLDLAVSDEAAHTKRVSIAAYSEVVEDLRSDLLLGDVELGRGVAVVVALADTVDLVVDRRAVVVSVLTGTGDGPLDVGRMPGTDTSDLSETLVRLSRELLGAPSAGDALEAVALGDGDHIDDLVLLKDGADLDGLLKQAVGKVDLVGDATAIDLDLHQVGLLLLERGLADLGVGEHADDGAVLLDALELAGDGGAGVLGVLLGVLGEGLLLAAVPVLVEPALDLVAEMLGPDCGEGSKTAGGLNVTN
jgi:hypothetical protein